MESVKTTWFVALCEECNPNVKLTPFNIGIGEQPFLKKQEREDWITEHMLSGHTNFQRIVVVD